MARIFFLFLLSCRAEPGRSGVEFLGRAISVKGAGTSTPNMYDHLIAESSGRWRFDAAILP